MDQGYVRTKRSVGMFTILANGFDAIAGIYEKLSRLINYDLFEIFIFEFIYKCTLILLQSVKHNVAGDRRAEEREKARTTHE